MVMDCTRTVIVWCFSMLVYYTTPTSGHGQPFSALQLAGFLVLILGSAVYYDVHQLLCRRGGDGGARPKGRVTSTQGQDPLLVNAHSQAADS